MVLIWKFYVCYYIYLIMILNSILIYYMVQNLVERLVFGMIKVYMNMYIYTIEKFIDVNLYK